MLKGGFMQKLKTPWLMMMALALSGALFLTGCHHNSSDSTSSGGGTSSQSVVTLKGAGQ